MKTKFKEPPDLDTNKVWDDVERVAARAPEWASTHPPYSVKSKYAGQNIQEKESTENK
jgi:hypothetical protein